MELRSRAALICCVLTLAACASTPARQVSGCACAAYQPDTPRPQWVEGESTEGVWYQSQGMADCTGIASLDHADAEKRARESLGRMIKVQVSSEVYSRLQDAGYGAVGHQGSATSVQRSDVMLKDSEIFARWVDAATCTVYAGARIRKADIERAMREAEQAEQRKPVNRRWRVASAGVQADFVAAQLAQALSRLGVTLDGESATGGWGMSAEVSGIERVNERLLRLTLRLVASDAAGNVVWNRLLPGKGVSFAAESQEKLIQAAIRDALERNRQELEVYMQGVAP
jgi:hypothetical protein